MDTKKEIKSIRFNMVLAPRELEAVDEWRRAEDDLPSRSEAIRRLIQKGLKESEKASKG